MKIYTKTGDKGTTSLVFGQRIGKDDIRVEAYGTCDEANSFIGLALSLLPDVEKPEYEEIRTVFRKIQTAIFHAGAELSTPKNREVQWKLGEEDVSYLESVIDKWDPHLPPLTNFILPGGTPAGSAFHTARTVARRAERCAVAIEDANPIVIAYLNRLSDLLFVAARYVNHLQGAEEDTLHQGK